MRFENLKKQAGVAVITMVVLVVILLSVIGAVVATSRTTASSTSDQTAKMMAAGIIDEGNMLKIGFDIMMAKGVDIDSITFGATPPNDPATPPVGVGLFNSLTGTAVVQFPPPDAYTLGAVSTGAGKWMWSRGGTVAAGTSNPLLTGVKWPSYVTPAVYANQYAVVLTRIKDSVCKQINLTLRGYDSNGAIPVVTATAPVPKVTTNHDPNEYSVTAQFDISDISFTGVTDTAGTAVSKLEGYAVCVSPGTGTTANNNVYINVVKPV